MDNIINHKYVVNNEESQPIVLEVLNFLHALNDLGSHDKRVCFLSHCFYCKKNFEFIFDNQIITPRMAVPRIPHDVIFLTGGWQNRPVSIVETYDTRGWKNSFYSISIFSETKQIS